MSYFDNITPKAALQSLGLQKRDDTLFAMEMVLPVLSAFGLGVGIGVGVGLLLAPKSGRELRDDLAAKAGQLRDDLSQRAEKIQSNVKKSLPAKPIAKGYEAEDH